MVVVCCRINFAKENYQTGTVALCVPGSICKRCSNIGNLWNAPAACGTGREYSLQSWRKMLSQKSCAQQVVSCEP